MPSSDTPRRINAASALAQAPSKIRCLNSATSGVSMMYPASASSVAADSLYKEKKVVSVISAKGMGIKKIGSSTHMYPTSRKL